MQRFAPGSAVFFIHYLCRWTNIKQGEAKAYSILYLLEELCQDAQDLADFKEQQALVRAFARKLSWLKTIIKNSPS
jgi:biopolymer transport protein ExbB/TolQ